MHTMHGDISHKHYRKCALHELPPRVGHGVLAREILGGLHERQIQETPREDLGGTRKVALSGDDALCGKDALYS